MKIWISQYALSEGVIETEGETGVIGIEGETIETSMVRLVSGRYVYGEGKNWHRTREGAVARAEEMRKRKISSLRKQLELLEAMCFL